MITKNTFIGGLNKDLSKTKLHQQEYDDALNVRMFTDTGVSTGALANIRGNKLFFTFPTTGNILRIDLTQGFSPYTFTGNLTGTFTSSATTLVDLNEDLVDYLDAITNLKAYSYGAYVYVYSTIHTNLSATVTNGTITQIIAPQSDLTIIGWTTIRDSFIILTTDKNNINPTGSNVSQIWKLDYDKSILQTNPAGSSTLTLLYNNRLDLSLTHPIVSPGNIIGNYENADIQKIYWCDFYNQRRYFNTANPDGFFLLPEELFAKPVVEFDIPYMTGLIQGSGNLTAGLYYFAYRYTNVTGATTAFSPASQLITIVGPSEQSFEPIKNYAQGANFTDINITKTLQLRIDNVDTRFDRLQMAFIRWTSTNNITSSPDDLGIFYDEPVGLSTNYLDITYSGNEKVQTITIDDYLIPDASPDIHKSITAKDNMALIANVKTKKLDLEITPGIPFDCRAVRYTASNATINPLTTYTTGTLPDEQNDINPNQTPISRNNYLYQDNGNILGGTGFDPGTGLPNIEYKFVTEEYHLDAHPLSSAIAVPAIWDPGMDQSTIVTLNNKTYNNILFFKDAVSPSGVGVLRSYQRNEIYRFGIVFLDKNGNPGWVKWIADIQFPDFYMPDLTSADPEDRKLTYPLTRYDGSANAYSQSLGIQFTVNNLQLVEEKISGYYFVRVKREDQDKTIISQGIMSVLQQDGTGVNYTCYGSANGGAYNTLNTSVWSSTHAGFYSPEVLLKNRGLTGTNSLEITGVFNDSQEKNLYTNASTAIVKSSVQKMLADYNPHARVNTRQGAVSATGLTAITRSFLIDDSHLFQRYPDDTSATIFTTLVKNQSALSGGLYYKSQGNRNLVVKLNGSSNFQYIWAVNDPNFGNVYSNVDGIDATDRLYAARIIKTVSNQYGGNSASQKSTNEYIYCNHYTPVDSTTTSVTSKVFGGDVWIQLMDFGKEFKGWDVDNANAAAQGEAWTYVFPTESSINIGFRYGAQVFNRSFVPNTGTGTTLDTYEDFSYPLVVSNEHQVLKFLPKPIPFITNTDFDTRVHNSQVKIQGELGDSWTVFKTSDYRDVESEYGPINNIATIKNQLYFWQDKSFGILPVNRRVLLQDTTSSTLQLGKGDTLEKHEYITNKIGCKHQSSIIVTDKAAYWYDVLGNKQIEFTQAGVNPYSDLKGFHSYLDLNVKGSLLISDNTLLDKGVNGYYDYKYNEVVHTFHDIVNGSNKKFTIVYNTLSNTYSSFYSFQPTVYVTDKYITFSHDNNNKTLNFVHDYGDYGNFYGQYYDSSVKFLTNQNPNITKVFNNLELQTEVQLSNVDTSAGLFPVQETINKIRFTNDTQDSGLLTLTSGTDIKRKFRTWRTDVARDSNNSAVVSFGYKSRMRDKYMYTEVFFTNNGNKRFILHDVLVGFTGSQY